MSNYATMRSIKLQNEILTPKVLEAYRNGNLVLNDLQDVNSPLRQIYLDTYNYFKYPDTLSSAEQAKINIVTIQPWNMNGAIYLAPRFSRPQPQRT